MDMNEKAEDRPSLRPSHTFNFKPACKFCKYWSELIAQAAVGGPVEALCLATEHNLDGNKSPFGGEYTTSDQYCEFFSAGQPIDIV